ncbi:MAG: carboxyl transferase domain-containing protein, partial [Pseudomonadota bacterium]
AQACADAGLAFVGPTVDTLALFGDKVRARQAAKAADVPIINGTDGETSLDDVKAFFADLPAGSAMIIKAVSGGGGRGMRVIKEAAEIEESYERAGSEAKAAFGNAAVYVERFMPNARHIEIQVVGDGSGTVTDLGDRDCSVQRRHQKVLEIAPAPALPDEMREGITSAALRLAASVNYRNVGTFEFLVDANSIAFIEANARLQVEHTVTEEVTGVDIVRTQLEIARGKTISDLPLDKAQTRPRGFAIQARVNMERMTATGETMPTGGTLTAFQPPTGPGLRTDTFGYAGYTTSPRYDSLLAKVIASSNDTFEAVADQLYRALSEFRIEGLTTNIAFLQNLLRHDTIRQGAAHTRFIDENIADLVTDTAHPTRFFGAVQASPTAAQRAGAAIDNKDPLAVLDFGKTDGASALPDSAPVPSATPETAAAVAGPDGTTAVTAPLQGTIVSLDVAEGDTVAKDQQLLIMESMKMEHEVRATCSGIIRQMNIEPGDTIYEGHPLLFIEEGEVDIVASNDNEAIDPDYIRPDLAEIVDRQERARDEKRPYAVERRRNTGQRTARENVEDLCDPGTFVEYGPLTLAAQRRRRTIDDLILKTAADGLITGVGAVNGEQFPDPDARCAVMAYDYTVLAGTQGLQNHRKTDRIIDVAEQGQMPMILFSEGGGGRPGDTDGIGGSGGNTFAKFATLSGLVPVIGINSGKCFAGNASLLGCCDVIIATEDSNIGMGGPAMIEGGGLGVYAPEDIGPMSVQVPNGVVDIAVKDEAEAVAVTKKYLSYFQGPLTDWESPDQRLMRQIVPENRLRVYEVRDVINTIADVGSVLEIRQGFGHGMVTVLVRIEGRPVGIIANDPKHLGGAIDSDASDKGARFMQLCDAFDIPILHFCDTPGIMVGPEVERTALVRHAARMFITGANLSVPFFTIILRKAYGLGAIAMAGGSYKTPFFTVSWPTGEFGGMGLEGSVKLGFRNELAAIEDPAERLAEFERRVANAYETGKALNYASLFSVDDTIDPADSRWWVSNLLKSVRVEPRHGKKRPAVDAW